MKLTWKVAALVASAAIVGGYGAGTVISATADDTPSKNLPVPAVQDGKYALGIAPYQVLGNGKTAGDWRPDTPVSQRPDFMPVVLDDGTHGFVKRSDIDDGLVLPVLPEGVVGKVDPKAIAAAQSRQRNVMVQLDSNGELWARVYAADGVTVIGKKLMSDAADSTSNDN